MEVGVDAVEGERLLPHQPVHTEERLPVELHQRGLAGLVDEAEGVDAEALHHPVRARDGPVRHHPHEHVGRLGDQRHEVPERRVGGLRLRDLDVGLGLAGVDQVRELDAVADEEHRDVVADEIEVALRRVELRGEAADVAHRVGRAARPEHGREPREHRRADARLQERRAGDRLGRAVGLEHAVRGGAARVDDALGDALVVEVHHLLAKVEVVHERRPAGAGGQRVVGVRDAHTLRGGEVLAVLRRHLAGARAGDRCTRRERRGLGRRSLGARSLGGHRSLSVV